jgi:uncharacterized coiled-coil protein SlyX
MISDNIPGLHRNSTLLDSELNLSSLELSQTFSMLSIKETEFESYKFGHRAKESRGQDIKIGESALFDRIDQLSQLFESFDLRQFSCLEDGSGVEEGKEMGTVIERMKGLILRQDKIIKTLQEMLVEKNDAIEILHDEMDLCKNNIVNVQKQIRDIKMAPKLE